MNSFKSKYLPFLIWLFPLLFFAYQFILRLWPALMMQPIMEKFALEASGFGLLAAVYYYGYAGMQIPVAILLDKLGPRWVISLSATVCGLAMLVFSHTSSFYLALICRFLIGAGSTAGFLGASKVISQWFSVEKYSQMVGFTFTFGLMGAIYGGKPLGLLVTSYAPQSVAYALGILSLALGLCIFLVVRSPKISNPENQPRLQLADLSFLLNNRALWILAFANLFMVGSLEGFADVWGVPYLMQAYELSKPDAAFLVSFIFFGMLFGGPLLAYLSKKISDYVLIALCGLGICLLFTLIISQAISNWWVLALSLFAVGLFCCYQVVVFSAGSKLVEVKYLSIGIAFLNCMNMFGGSLFHTLIGRIMDLFWEGQVDATGMRIYSLTSFHLALALIPLLAGLGALLMFYLTNKTLSVNHEVYTSE